MLKTKIKAAQISNLTDARYFAAWYCDWLGFCCDSTSMDYVSPQLLHAIRDWVEGPQIVGEFGAQDAVRIHDAVKDLNLDAVQVGFYYDAEKLENLKGLTVIREVVIDPNEALNLHEVLDSLSPFVAYFLLDFSKNNIGWDDLKNNSGHFSAETIKSICATYPTLISINVNADKVNELLETLNPEGLNLLGGEEEKVGFKSYDEMDELLEALETV